nr:MAG TPA: hypothetical protein [Caudoviricetes sp.]
MNVYEIFYSFIHMNILFYLHFVITSDSFVNFDFFYGVKFKNILSKKDFRKMTIF